MSQKVLDDVLIQEVGNLKVLKSETAKTYRELLKEMKLDDKYFVLLVNKKRVTDLSKKYNSCDTVVLLPKIAGGKYSQKI
jgi:sulfur carrier protein ThiS